MLLAVNVRNIGNDISRVNTFYIGPYRHTGSTDSGIGRVCYCWITLHIERYALSLKFANRTVPVLTISWKSIIISRWRACKQVKSAIHLSSTRFICPSIPCLCDSRFPTANENSIELSSKTNERNRDMAASCQVLFSIARLRFQNYRLSFLCCCHLSISPLCT